MANNNINLILGNHGSGKTHFIYKYFLENKNSADGTLDLSKKFYLIVPEQDTQARQKEMIDATKGDGDGILNADVISFDRLAYMVLSELNININNEKIADEDTKKILLYKSIQNLIKKGEEFVYFKYMKNKLGFTEKLKSSLSEFYSYNVDKNMLDDAYKKIDNDRLKLKIHELNIIQEEFKNLLDKNNYKINEDKLNLLYKHIDKTKIFEDAYVFFDGFTGFTPIQKEIFAKISEKSKEVYVSIDIRDVTIKNIIKDYGFKNINEKDLFYLSKTFVNLIYDVAINQNKNINEKNVIYFDHIYEDVYNGKEDLIYLEKNIYKYNKENNYKGKVDNISIHKCRDIDAEVDYLIYNIEKLKRENNMSLNDIKVIVPSIKDYNKIILEKCKLRDINVYIDYEYDIYSSPIVEAVRSSLEVVYYNFNYDSVMRYINAGIYEKDEDIYEFDNMIRRRGIRSKKRYESIKNINTEIFTPLFNLYDSIGGNKKSNNIRAYVDAIYKYIEDSKLNERFNKLLEKIEDKNSLDYIILDKSKNVVDKILSDLYDICDDKDERVSLKEFIELFDIGFDNKKVKISPFSLEVLECGDLMRSRYNNPKVVFMMGLNDSRVPGRFTDNNIIDDAFRKIFKDKVNIVLSQTTRETALNQRFYIYLAMTNAKNKLFLSYTNKNNEGTSDYESSILASIRKMYDIKDIVEDKNNYDFYNKKDVLDYVYNHMHDAKTYIKNVENGKIEEGSNDKYYNNAINTYNLYKYICEKLTDDELRDYKKKTLLYYDNINVNIIKDLLGEYFVSNVSKLEDFAACPYKYFLDYTISLTEREEYTIDNKDIGIVFHKVLENIFEDPEFNVLDCSEKMLNEEIEKITESIYDERDKFRDTNFSKFLSERIKDILVYSISKLKNKINVGEPIHVASEHNIKYDIEGSNDKLNGRIDTIDMYEDGNNDYIKIVDYKSSNKEYDEKLIEDGIDIQYIVYLDYILKNVKTVLTAQKINCDDKKLKKALGTFYFNIHDKLSTIKRDTDIDIIRKEIDAEYKFSGIVNKEAMHIMDPNAKVSKEDKIDSMILKGKALDEEELDNIFKKVNDGIKTRIGDIKAGKIEVKPHIKANPCKFCNYQTICKKSLRNIEEE